MAISLPSFKIILGSSSVARRQILLEMGYEFEIRTAGIDEKAIRKEKPEELVTVLAKAKADAILSRLEITDYKDAEPTLLITSDIISQKSKALNNGGQSSGMVEANMDTLDSEDMLKKNHAEDEVIVSGKDDHFWCTCSKNLTCKTIICKCRYNNKLCSSHCGCISKCVNREDACQIR